MDYWVQHTQMWLNNTYGNNPNWVRLDENGLTGWNTIYGLTRALQIELGLSNPNGNFGPATTQAVIDMGVISKGDPEDEPSNIITIMQGALWCKGYNAGGLTGIYYNTGEAAVKQLQEDIGINATGLIDVYMWKCLLNMNAFVLLANGDPKIREIQQYLNRNYIEYMESYAPCDGFAGRDTFTGLIFAIQAEEGFGPNEATGFFGDNTEKSWPTVEEGQNNIFVKLLKIALYFNGYDVGDFTTAYVSKINSLIIEFQKFMCLIVTGSGDGKTLRNLLTSNGDQSLDRPATAFDCAMPLNQNRINILKSNGFKIAGRYITSGEFSWGNKQLTRSEAELIIKNGLSIFPIYQTSANYYEYFSTSQGVEDAKNAYNLATKLGIPKSTTIYFAVDCDPTEDVISSRILPYFKSIHDTLEPLGYNIGVYGTRNVCLKVSALGYAKYSFVSGLSSGFSGNLGFNMPTNWSFNQFHTYTYSTGNESIEVDRDGNSGRDVGFNSLNINKNNFQSELEKLYNLAFKYGAKSDDEALDLTLQYLREVGNYNGTICETPSEVVDFIKWTYVAGSIDKNFVNYASKYVNNDYLQSFNTPGMENLKYDFYHFAATLHALLHNVNETEWTEMDYVIDRYAGWAGDLSTLAADTKNNGSSGNLNEVAENLMGSEGSTFSYIDYIADIDAVNVSETILNGKSNFLEIIDNYFFTVQADKHTYSEIRTYLFIVKCYQGSLTIFNSDVDQIMNIDAPLNILRNMLSNNAEQKYFDAAIYAFKKYVEKQYNLDKN